MSVLVATAGSRFYIGPELASTDTDFDEDDFNGSPPLTFTEVGQTTNLGESGDTSELITTNEIARARTRKLKGVRNAGSMTVVCDFDSSDSGQTALINAEKTAKSYAFKIEFNDAPTSGTPSTRYFCGFVMSAVESLNEANNVISLNTTIEIDSNIVKVAASA